MRGALAVAALLLAAPVSADVVKTAAGPVRGETEGGHLVFRGIPFAAPPTGERRWRPPAPPAPWHDTRDATRPAPACPQADFGWNKYDHVFQSEDCLTLDIGTERTDGRRPVLVWIHGGSNAAGSPGDTVRSSIVARGIVMVAVRYRLGALGFLMHRRAGGGNVGLQDQIAALRWVQGNIARFGGDPAQVTIAGESAGAQDVGLLMAAPAARGLFRRAILESGTPGFGLPWRTRDEALRLGDQVDASLSTGGDADALRRAAAWPVIAAGEQTHDAALTDGSYRWLRTTIDGDVLPDTPERLLATVPAVDVLIGSNRFELDLPGGRSRRDAFVAAAYGANEAAARAVYRLDDPDPAPDPRLGTRDQQIATDATFRCPVQRMAALMAQRGARVWAYEFDEGPAAMTHHAAELAYVYGDRRLGDLHLMEYWANFVKAGDPNGGTLPRWPAYDAAGTMLSLSASGAEPSRGLHTEICRLATRL